MLRNRDPLYNILAEMEEIGPRRKELWRLLRGRPGEPVEANRAIVGEAFAAGFSPVEVGDLTGISHATAYEMREVWRANDEHKTTDKSFGMIRNLLQMQRRNREWLTKQYNTVTARMKELVAQAYEMGASIHQIHRHSGVHRPTLNNWLGLNKARKV